MTIRVGINGFGRIGRMVTRALQQDKNIHLMAINDPFIDLELMAYMLKYDTVRGRFEGKVDVEEGKLVINGNHVIVHSELEPCNIPWGRDNVDYVIEASGAFTTYKKAVGHMKGGARKVIVSAPSSDIPMFVLGVNEEKYKREMDVVSNGSCTMTCLAPLAKVIHEKFGIVEGLMTTIHAITGTQKAVDGPHSNEWRRGRAASENIVPLKTGAARNVGDVYPPLKGKLTGLEVRVPVQPASLIDFTVRLQQGTSLDAIKECVKDAAKGPLKGILDHTDEFLVSTDLRDDRSSCIFDANSSMTLNDHFVKLLAWYDNEYGYSCRLLDLVTYMHKVDQPDMKLNGYSYGHRGRMIFH